MQRSSERPADVTIEALGMKSNRVGVQTASRWLVWVLSGGEVLATEVLRQAKEAGISERTLERAKEQLHVQSRKIRVGKEARWAWSMTNHFGRIIQTSDLPKLDEEEDW